MQLLKRQETPTGNIALLGIFSAVLAVFSLIIAFIPFTSIAFGLFLPLISAVAAYYVQKKYIPLYMIGASLICIGVTFFNIGDTLFFVIPSIFSGSLFGFMRTKRILPQLNIFIISIVQFILHILAYYLLMAITGVDMLDVVVSLLSLNGSNNYMILFISALLSISFGETGINYLIIEGVLEKFSAENIKENIITRLINASIAFVLGLICILMGSGIVASQPMPIMFVIMLYFSISGADYLFTSKRPIWIYVLLSFLIIASLFFVAIFYQSENPIDSVGLLASFPISLSLVTFVSILENKMAQ